MIVIFFRPLIYLVCWEKLFAQSMHNLHAFVLVVSEGTIRKYSMK